MRVGIYAYGPSTITLDRAAVITRFSPDGAHADRQVAAGQVSLPAGIHRIISKEPITVVGSVSCDLFVSLNDASEWPDPATTFGRFRSTFPEITYRAIQEFFPVLATGTWAPGQTSRLGIYAYEPATISVDKEVTIGQFQGAPCSAERKAGPGKVLLETGIYRIYADTPVRAVCDGNSDITVMEDYKSGPPDIAATLGRFSAAFPGVTQAQLREFFPSMARGFELPWASAEAVTVAGPAYPTP